MSVLTIVRGLPGSGKSTYARKLAADKGVTLIEPDALLVDNGGYVFSDKRWIKAVRICRHVLEMLGAMNADCIYADVLPSILDVGSLYYDYCVFGTRHHGLDIIDMPMLTLEESMERNIHGVRKRDLERMIKSWQPRELMKGLRKEAPDGTIRD